MFALPLNLVVTEKSCTFVPTATMKKMRSKLTKALPPKPADGKRA